MSSSTFSLWGCHVCRSTALGVPPHIPDLWGRLYPRHHSLDGSLTPGLSGPLLPSPGLVGCSYTYVKPGFSTAYMPVSVYKEKKQGQRVGRLFQSLLIQVSILIINDLIHYLHIDHVSMCLHTLNSCQGTSILHDDFAVVGFTQSKYREACAALLTHLQQNVKTIL